MGRSVPFSPAAKDGFSMADLASDVVELVVVRLIDRARE